LNLIELAAWLAGLLGFGLLIGGIALVHVPAALIVAGLLLLAWAYIADKAVAAQRRQAKPGGG